MVIRRVHVREDELQACVDGALNEINALRVRLHVATCGLCRELMESLSTMREVLSQSPATDPLQDRVAALFGWEEAVDRAPEAADDAERDAACAAMELWEELEACGFRGPWFDLLIDELWLYADACLRSWLRNGTIAARVRAFGIPLHPTAAELELWTTSLEVRDELAVKTVELGIKRLKSHVLPRGQWNPRGGASLPTYFVTACLLRFPDVFAAWRNKHRNRLRIVGSLDLLEGVPLEGPDLDDAWATRSAVARILGAAPPDTRAVCVRLMLGDTYREAGAAVGGLTERAVEGRLYRLGHKAHAMLKRGEIWVDHLWPGAHAAASDRA